MGGIGQALSQPGIDWTGRIPLLVVGAFLIVVGLLFKVGAVPFHSWTPDVYAGAPTPVTGFMAACTKVAAFGALLRVLYLSLPALEEDWQPALWRRRRADDGARLAGRDPPDRHQADARLLARSRTPASSSPAW